MKAHIAGTVEAATIADVQGSPDHREIAIDKVGIKDLRHPLTVRTRDAGAQPTVATVSMSVALPHHVKGTHMSRFVDILNEEDHALSLPVFKQLLDDMRARLAAQTGYIVFRFPFFVRKTAPVSGAPSFIDYEVSLSGFVDAERTETTLQVLVPVTSLCPCSKEISDYGAHNQRSHIMVRVRANAGVWIEDLIETVERQASAELYGSLKRSDEKLLTEKAYDNPKFVEDVVRDVAAALDSDRRIDAYVVTVENFESIHNHSAFAEIRREK